MASLQTTAITGTLTAGGYGVWYHGNDGTGTALNANDLWGYDIRYLDANRRLTFLDLTTGSTGTFYPMTFASAGVAPANNTSANQWGSGVSALHIRRTNVHQEGGGYGSLFGRLRYRSSQWGHHQAFWELTENWGNGSYYPFIAGATMQGETSYTCIFLRGGLSYWYRFDSPDTWENSAVATTKPFPNYNNTTLTVSSTTTVGIPGNARYYAQGISVKSGYNFGDPNFRWNVIYGTATNASSDARIKENIGVVLGTEFLSLLKPVSYTRIGDADQRRAHGFIAQEVKEAMDKLGIPLFGGYDDASPDKLALRYSEFIATLIKTLQEKRDRVVALTAKITALEGKA